MQVFGVLFGNQDFEKVTIRHVEEIRIISNEAYEVDQEHLDGKLSLLAQSNNRQMEGLGWFIIGCTERHLSQLHQQVHCLKFFITLQISLKIKTLLFIHFASGASLQEKVKVFRIDPRADFALGQELVWKENVRLSPDRMTECCLGWLRHQRHSKDNLTNDLLISKDMAN